MSKRNLSLRFIKYMNKHLGHNFWITPSWAGDYYSDYCMLGERKSITLDPNYHKIVEAMEDKMDEIAGWEQKEWKDPHAYMRNPNWCGTFLGKPGHILDGVKNKKKD